MNKIIDPFSMSTPSVFVVWSPFQILCAVSAIRQFAIKDYLLLVRLYKGDARNQQILNILNKYELRYKPVGKLTKFKSK